MSRSHLLLAASNECWAIDPGWLRKTFALFDVAGGNVRQTPRRAEVHADRAVVLPMLGVISQRGSIWSSVFGGTSTEGFGAAFVKAINDPRVNTVVLDIDSPGGTISGVKELADLIWQGRRSKRVVAVANSLAASAAYWLGSQTGKGNFFASPGAEVGSIGVFRVHEDISEMLAADGIKITFLSTPEFKTEANPYEPLSAAAKQHHLGQVEAAYQMFLADVVRGRGWSSVEAPSRSGRGRTFHAAQAASMGLVDGVKTLSQVLVAAGVGSGDRVMGLTGESLRLEMALQRAMAQGRADGVVGGDDNPPPGSAAERRNRMRRLLERN